MPIAAPSSVSSTMRTSSVVEPSGRPMIQSAPPGSTVPLSFGPSNVPPETRPMRRLPFGMAPIGCMPPTVEREGHQVGGMDFRHCPRLGLAVFRFSRFMPGPWAKGNRASRRRRRPGGRTSLTCRTHCPPDGMRATAFDFRRTHPRSQTHA